MWGQNKTMGWGTGDRGNGWKWGEGKLRAQRLERSVIECHHAMRINPEGSEDTLQVLKQGRDVFRFRF